VVGQPETESSGHHCREDKVSSGSKWIDGFVKCIESFQTHSQEVDHEEGCAGGAQTMTDGSDDFDHKPPPITGALLKSAARALSDRLSIEVIGICFAAQGAARGYWFGTPITKSG